MSAWKPTHRHVKRETDYQVIGVALLQTEILLQDDARLIVYRGEDGELWARRAVEFADGRFERLPPGSDPTPDPGLREVVARLNDPRAWANLDEERKRYPADPYERFLEAADVKASLTKADAIIAAIAERGGV